MAEGLIADIGGTNIRIARVTAEGGMLAGQREYRCAGFPNVDAALEQFIADAGMARPQHVALAVASAVTGDVIQFTNSSWRFSQAELQARLGLASLRVFNDFEALALSLPHLSSNDRCEAGGGAPVDGAPIAVIGPGTGLGVGAVVQSGGAWLPISSEGGHATLAPANEFETELLRAAWGERSHVSCEAFISGTGLPILYRAVARVRNEAYREDITADEIGTLARDGADALCVQTARAFCDLLGTAAGNVALTFCARGGVFIGGGIVPKILPLFLASAFRSRFESKGRFASYLSPIPTWVITSEMPALAGLAAAMTRILRAGNAQA